MDLQNFVKLFSAQFDETPADEFNAELSFRDLDEWSSLTALSVIAIVDDEFDIQLTGEDIRNSITIKDIYNVVIKKKGDK